MLIELCLMSNVDTPLRNQLLSALGTEEFNRLSVNLELVKMPLGQVLHEPGEQLKYVYFPISSIVSLLYVLESGASAEIAIVGKEGILGISLFMGGGNNHESSRGAKCRLRIPPQIQISKSRV